MGFRSSEILRQRLGGRSNSSARKRISQNQRSPWSYYTRHFIVFQHCWTIIAIVVVVFIFVVVIIAAAVVIVTIVVIIIIVIIAVSVSQFFSFYRNSNCKGNIFVILIWIFANRSDAIILFHLFFRKDERKRNNIFQVYFILRLTMSCKCFTGVLL